MSVLGDAFAERRSANAGTAEKRPVKGWRQAAGPSVENRPAIG
jgi:hypothetical protein